MSSKSVVWQRDHNKLIWTPHKLSGGQSPIYLDADSLAAVAVKAANESGKEWLDQFHFDVMCVNIMSEKRRELGHQNWHATSSSGIDSTEIRTWYRECVIPLLVDAGWHFAPKGDYDCLVAKHPTTPI